MFFPIVLAIALSAKTSGVVEPASNLILNPADGVVTLRWSGTPGVLYQVEGRDINSSSTNWEAIGAPTTNFMVSEIQTVPMKIYRVGIYTNTSQYQLNVATETTPPTIPQGFTIVSTNASQVMLRWNASTDPGNGSRSSGVKGYQVYRGVGVSVPPTNWLKTVLAPNTNYSDTTVATATTYSYSVRAFDSAALTNFSGFSTTNWATTPSIITTTHSPSGSGTTSGGGTKNYGTSVTVTATPNSCYSFVNWTESGANISSSASYTFTANGNRTLVANFALTTYSIATSGSPSVGGSTSGGGAVSCGSSVTVTATTTNSCYSFVNWTEGGTVVSASTSYTFTASSNRTLVANFALTTYSIATSSSPSAGGSTSGGGTKNCGSSVTVTATPALGYNFVNWTEGATVVSTSASYAFTASGNRTLVANFSLITCTYLITTSSSPSGGGSTSGGGTKNCGSNVTVTATANSCYSFVNWTEGATVVSTSASYTFTANANRTLVANFALITYSVTTSSSPSGGGTTSGGGTKNCGSSVTVTATANSCYSFVNWTEGATVVSTSASYTFTANANRTLVANFALITYSVTTSSSPSGGGSTSGGGTVNCGSSVTVTATPNAGYNFVNWTEGGTQVSASASYTFTASGSRTLAANFTATSSGGGITTNLVGYWTFDAANVSGTTVLDSSGNTNNGTLQGTVLPTIVSGKIAQAVNLVNLAGASNLVTVPSSSSLNITGSFTVSTWVNFNTLPVSGTPSVVAKLADYKGYGLFRNGSGVSGIIGPGSGWYITSPSPTPASNTWNHYAAVFDGANLKLYVNGVLHSQVTAAAPGDTTGVPVKMGRHYGNLDNNGYINGQVDDARIYNRALSAADVTQLYNYTGSTGCTYTISTSSSPSGGGSTSGGGTVNCGSGVTVTATANSCYSFVNWTEGATVVSTSASYTFTASASRTLVANFALVTYSITTSSSPSGGGSTSGGGTKNCGSSVTVTATPASCYSFVNWTEGATVVSASASYTFTASASRTLVANFALVTYSITTSSSPSGGGSTSGGGTKNCGSSVTVTATPASCYSFVNWTEGATVVSTSASYTFTASASRTLVANFALVTYSIATSSSPASGGSTSGGGTKNCGSSVTVVATTNAGFNFVNWTQSGSNVSASASYTFTASANRTLVANFTPAGNIAPVSIPGTNQMAAVGTNVSLIGGNSYDPDGTITNYTWAFGDGVSASGMNVSHAYTNAGTYAATLTVKDNLGATGTSNAVVTVTNSTPATPGQLIWVRTSSAQPGPNAVQLAVGSDPSGNGVSVGWFSGTVDFGTGPISTTSTLDTDGFIMKRDSQGNPLWTKRLGNYLADKVTGVVVDSQGNIIVTGYFSTNVDFGGTTLTSVPYPVQGVLPDPDIFVAKYSPSGGLLWVKGFGGGYDDRGVAVAVDGSNNVVIASQFQSISVNFGGVVLNYIGNYNVAVVKLSSTNGTTVWASSGGVGLPTAVTVDRFGDVIVAGNFTGGNLAKYSGVTGNFIWAKPTGAANGVATDPATGNIFVTGGNAGIYLSAYDPSGQTNLWTKTTGSGTDSGVAVAMDASGNLVLTGKAADAINFGTWPQNPWMFGNGQPNMFVAAFTVSGNLPPVYRWTKVTGAGSTGSSGGTGIALDSLGHVLAGGYFTATIDFGGISATTTGGYNAAFLAQYSK